MKVAVIADSHFDLTSRWDECIAIHDWIAGDIAGRGVDVVLHAGDVYEKRSTPAERMAVAKITQRMADTSPVVFVRGNHDHPGDLKLLERLKTKHPVIVEEAAGVHTVAGLNVAAMAWPRKGDLAAMAARAGIDDVGRIEGDVLRDVLTAMNDLVSDDLPTVFLGHTMIRGSKTSLGQPLVGHDFELGLDDLAIIRADAYLLGHIHMPQDWMIGNAPVIYPGSPRRTAFGEIEDKGYLILEFEGKMLKSWERVQTPARQMLLVRDHWCGDWTVGEDIRGIPGSEIRFTYTVAPEHREAAKFAAESLKRTLTKLGAVLVKVDEEVVPSARARAPDVTEAKGLEEKLRVLWASRNETIEDRRAQRLFAKVRELEEMVKS